MGADVVKVEPPGTGDDLAELEDADVGERPGHQPSVNGSRVAPVSSTQTDLLSVYSRIASTPFSRPMPLWPKPPNGTWGPTTR
ncbi:MAG TPA: hypothetical protein VNU26_06665 [Mycobacteriales bacterium]|nr:hypothetical protein [Mycobacteriales bacterium]